MRTLFLTFVLSLLLGCEKKTLSTEVDLIQKAQRIHLNALTLYTHDYINLTHFSAETNYAQDTDTQVNLPKMERGGLDVAWFVVYTGQGELDAEGYKKAAVNAQSKFEGIHRLVDTYAPMKMGLATSVSEVDSLRKLGKKIAMIVVENAYPLGENLSEIKRYFDLGARYMSLAHNGHNQFSDSNTGEFDATALHNGISELGKKVIDSMNYYGIMVDISHPSKEAIRQTIHRSKAPVIASHSGVRALSDHPRNLDDEQLDWVKANGGVVQAVALALFVNKTKQEKHQEALEAVYRKTAKQLGMEYLTSTQQRKLSEEDQAAYELQWEKLTLEALPQIEQIKKTHPPVNVSDFVDHVDYLKNKIGIDHVGISSDFDGGGGIDGWKDASETFNVTLELVKRGYSEEEIYQIWSGNLLRVLKDVETIAEQLQQRTE